MLDKDDVQIIDHKVDGEKTMGIAAIRAPMAVPATAGMRGTVVTAFIIAAIAAPFFAPALLLEIAVFNGILALGWFTLYRKASTLAARYRNELTITEIINDSEFERQLIEMIEEKKGNLSDSELSNKDGDETTVITEQE